ncbi:MAG: hypothetical protein A2599_00630 [Candidatus Staskawiczbacteria bacterium RIFOXYD1_FULL_39_28]|uniref:Phosphatidic acid phosphatase type 2/haloperoxidase domain-containing protein n=1 Tax=Candidatus Staskawiczbacteria bacterium RIFOXYC1_FULL_38_18 TaxID=1802229 RepID=A0A1G2JCB7_9BACT|nr:MAG: hypothetical protein A2401_02495 [Candidatus Staskawiczbacteria bacterium RIFOXYC1_FULL_38_18]OGZ91473.1 MAG: hypothetical protein A2599_00630 [Candidatus Staskawiczbacteria bacterium RIFOXYD1_FULL_39_28]
MYIDLYLFNLVHGFARRWEWLDYFGIFFAKYLEYFLLACLLVLLAVSFRKYWRMVLGALVAGVFSRFVLAEIIRWLWFRPRPFVVLNFSPLISKSAEEASFPSGHATFYFALSTIIYLYNKKLGWFFYIASFLIVISRVFVGIHWLSDILVGAIIGTAVAFILNKLFKKYENLIFGSGRSV